MMTDLIPSLFVPVTLGSGRREIRAARRLFWQYGLATHMFGDRLPLFCRLTPWIVCHSLPHGLSDEFRAMALYDFAAEAQECDRQPLLIVCGEDAPPLSEQDLALLESRYLICRERDLASLLAPALHSSEGGTPI
ncbi:MAG: hypothetical protein IKY29_01205 [Clostridia bacterium]|nr:hypothetical protein [Clostridia bacterium]